ncbi:hypothetical protein D3C85_880220 [compost metagenome]
MQQRIEAASVLAGHIALGVPSRVKTWVGNATFVVAIVDIVPIRLDLSLGDVPIALQVERRVKIRLQQSRDRFSI